MNRYPEAINALLAWLLQESSQTVSAPSGETPSHQAGPDEFGTTNLQWHDLDPLDSEEVEVIPDTLNGLSNFPFSESLLLELGDIPAVQERFYTLLKRRLRAEIERNPPLFPWETEVYDYSSEGSDWTASDMVPAQLWTIQLQQLNLPVPMPETLINNLFNQCQAVVQSSLREGAKLVQAVESLFPGHSATLNQLAGFVLASPVRSGMLLQSRPDSPAFPKDYEAATPAQQMALSLLAAREIINSLTLQVSPAQLKAARSWQTAMGVLELETEYQPQTVNRLRIQALLPCEGSIRFVHQDAQTSAQRSTPGYVSVELFEPEVDRIYPLEVCLTGAEQPSITFAVQLLTESK